MKKKYSCVLALIAVAGCGSGDPDQPILSQADQVAFAAAPQALAAAPLDSISFTGNRTSYTLSKSASGLSVSDATGRRLISVSSVASVKFADMTVNLLIGDKAATIAYADLKTLMELYVAFFNRIPDADGLAYWIDQFKAGQSIDQIADSFYTAAVQYTNLTGYSASMTAADFVRVIYKNVLGRSGTTAPPDADVQYWVGELTSARQSKGSLVRTMLSSAHSLTGDAIWGWVADLLNNKVAVAQKFAVEQGLNYNTATTSITQTMLIASTVTPTFIPSVPSQPNFSLFTSAGQTQGGDGGGDSSNSPAGTTTASATGLSIVNLAPNSVTSQIYESQTVPSITITGGLAGDITVLNGKTLYLFAIVPDPLFSSQPSMRIDAANRTASITLSGIAPPKVAKTYSNSITVRACLDPDCRTEIGNSNAKIPYTITVKPGLTVGSSNVAMNATFGTLPAHVTVPVTLPPGTTSWGVNVQRPTSAGWNWVSPIQVSKVADGTSGVVISAVRLAPAGSTYSLDIGVQAITPDGQTLYRTINVAYKTETSNVPYAFEQSGASFTVKYGYPNLSEEQSSSIMFSANTSDKMSLKETIYVAWPAAANDNSYRNKWLSLYAPNAMSSGNFPSNSYYSTVKVQACYMGNCLPIGRYSARIHFQYAPVTGPVSDLYYPVDMDVVP
ncbi:DUF4214 domain-containing protein [Herbaspirillum sp. HC18]|nr:DUF4214 domain-containing protein [Herbaspirillum sp. HC18]